MYFPFYDFDPSARYVFIHCLFQPPYFEINSFFSPIFCFLYKLISIISKIEKKINQNLKPYRCSLMNALCYLRLSNSRVDIQFSSRLFFIRSSFCLFRNENSTKSMPIGANSFGEIIIDEFIKTFTK